MTKEEVIEFGNMWLEMNEDCKDTNTYTFFQMSIKALEQGSCDDSISRQAVLSMQYKIDDSATLSTRDVVNVDDIEDLPPVAPKPKKGHWIKTNNYFPGDYENIDYVKCSCCNADSLEEGDYCPNCGAEMTCSTFY